MYVLSLKLGIREGDDTTAVQLCRDGYSSVSIPREGRIGGGIAIVHRSDITLRSKSVYNYQTMECADFCLTFRTCWLICVSFIGHQILVFHLFVMT